MEFDTVTCRSFCNQLNDVFAIKTYDAFNKKSTECGMVVKSEVYGIRYKIFFVKGVSFGIFLFFDFTQAKLVLKDYKYIIILRPL